MLKFVHNRLQKFRRDDEGSIVAEVVIMFPTLFAATIAIFVFFDAFRNQSINLKANYTIADAFSREDDYITNTFMNNTWRMHRFLTNSNALTDLRVSVIRFDADPNNGDGEYRVAWSRVPGGSSTSDFDDQPLSSIGLTANDVPVMPDNDTLIVVQTGVEYEPNFSIGLGKFTFENTTFTRPRWAPNLCYSHTGEDDEAVCPLNST